MKRKFDVYGVGNAIIDLQLRVSEEDITKLKLEKGGMRLVDAEEQRRLFSYFGARLDKQASGGSAANTMIALGQLGGTGAYACMVGEDAFGEFYLEEMKQLGVQIGTKPKGGCQTGSSVVLITPDAERTMNTNLGASVELSPDDVKEQQIAASQWLYIEGYLLAQENGRAVVERAVQHAKRHNTKVALTFSDGFIVDIFREPLEKVVKEADLIFANKNEGASFTGISASRDGAETEIFEQLLKRVPNVVLTLGASGVLCEYGKERHRVAAYPVTAVDDTGAGDMFAGAFLYGITHDLGVEQSARLACLLSSKVVSQLGPRLTGDVRQYRTES